MVNYNEFIGKTVRNDGQALQILLRINDFRHIGNFVFEGRTFENKLIKITTKLTNEDGSEIKISSIR
jgi:hypothetical protein